MAFREDNIYDEESGTSTPASILFIELKSKDAFIRITTPNKTKEELIRIFNQFKF